MAFGLRFMASAHSARCADTNRFLSIKKKKKQVKKLQWLGFTSWIMSEGHLYNNAAMGWVYFDISITYTVGVCRYLHYKPG